jgi:hypothetical protein
MDYIKQFFWLVVAGTFLASCKQEVDPPSEIFKQTWYAGKAEINTYALQQARYGEIRNGEAVLIFVTEDFSTEELVKLDEPEKTGDKVRVLKMNMTKNFVTGIYPYSMMLSVFTPVSKEGNEKTLKADCSSQEWCGQTFSQLQLKGNDYNWQLHSYFEKEGEQDKKLDAVLIEDELWNRIRINPSSLPQGKVSVLPGLLWQRLSHIELKGEEAVITLSKADSFFIKDSGVQMYTIHYPAAQRTLQIYFQSAFPHEILGWQENYPDGFGNNKKMLITKAVKKKTAWLDYWMHNALADTTYRDTLQLMP